MPRNGWIAVNWAVCSAAIRTDQTEATRFAAIVRRWVLQPVLALSDGCRNASILPQLKHKRTLSRHREWVAFDPQRSLP